MLEVDPQQGLLIPAQPIVPGMDHLLSKLSPDLFRLTKTQAPPTQCVSYSSFKMVYAKSLLQICDIWTEWSWAHEKSATWPTDICACSIVFCPACAAASTENLQSCLDDQCSRQTQIQTHRDIQTDRQTDRQRQTHNHVFMPSINGVHHRYLHSQYTHFHFCPTEPLFSRLGRSTKVDIW